MHSHRLPGGFLRRGIFQAAKILAGQNAVHIKLQERGRCGQLIDALRSNPLDSYRGQRPLIDQGPQTAEQRILLAGNRRMPQQIGQETERQVG